MAFGGTYLEPSGVFPDPRTSSRWGDEEVVLDFVGGPYLFEGLSAVQAAMIRDHFRDRCRLRDGDDVGQVRTTVFRANSGDFRHIDMTGGWEYVSMDYAYEPDRVRVAGLQLMAQLEFAPCLTGALWTPLERDDWFPGIVFENFFRVLVSYRLLGLGGVVLHSSSVVDRQSNRAWVFLGPSGAGKSTIAELAYRRGLQVVSDDLNSVMPDDGDFNVTKVPFTGTFAHELSDREYYLLDSFHRIVKGGENRLSPIGKAQLLAMLIGCSPFVNKDNFRFDRLCRNLERMIEKVPACELTFALDGECFDLLRHPQ
jgi:hypothetical protein